MTIKKYCPRCDQDISDSYCEADYDGHPIAYWYCEGCAFAILDPGGKDGGEQYECCEG